MPSFLETDQHARFQEDMAKMRGPLTYKPDAMFVADRQFDGEPAPASTTGVLGWLRENLFSTWLNAILTVVALALLAYMLPGLIDWAIFKSVWNASSLSECREIIATSFGAGSSGACWAVVHERFGQLMYGFYPAELRWRANVTLILMAVALVPVLFPTMRPLVIAMGGLVAAKLIYAVFAAIAGGASEIFSPSMIVAVAAGLLAYAFGGHEAKRRWIWFTLAYPFVAFVLLFGGFGLEPVASSRFGGFLLTALIGVTGISASLPLGILLALGRQSNLPALQILCTGFIEFIRGVPLITLLFVASTLLNYFLPPGTSFDILLRVIIMVTLFASAYMAEVVRGGLAALPRGQYEAAQSLGLGYWQGMRLIILPQALKISIPGIVNTFIGLFKDTTLVSIIGLFDPLGLLQPILADSNWNGIVWELYGFVAAVFFICCFAMSRYSMYLERRLQASDRR